MRLPFGLDLKSLVIGVILALFVWPWISSMLANVGSKNAS